MSEIFTKEDAFHFLSNIPLAVLATVNAAGQPSVATMHFVVGTDLSFYFTTETSTKKYQNILHNNKVSIVVSDRNLERTIQVEAVASRLVKSDELTHVIQQLARQAATHKSLHWPPPISKIESGSMVVIKAEPTWMRYGDFSKDNPSDIFTEIAL